MDKKLYCILAYTTTFLVAITFQMPPCLANLSSSSITKSLATDQTALLALKSHIISDPSRIIATNWTNSSSVCSWHGVTCSLRHQRVAALNLSYMNLSGTIPPQIGQLSFLVSIDLTSNHFSGTLPQEVLLLQRLKFISLRLNNFIGDIPSLFVRLTKLEYLSLGNNSFTGSLPKSLSNLTNLKTLDLTSNSLSGEIPEEFGRLDNLQILSIQYNRLSGGIPSAIFNISSLVRIAFTGNELSGSLPPDLCSNLPSLFGIYLSQNRLSGPIPTNLSQCSQLQILSLSINSFSGQIPAEIGSLTSLQKLYLGGNNLNGVLPHEIGNLQNLVVFDVGENHLTGDIPREFGLLFKLEKLNLELNDLSGSIPNELFNISTLRTLALDNNALTGFLPTNLCHDSPFLEELLIGTNSISGAIPNSISNCSQLRILSLEFNEFSGYIPTHLGNLRLLKILSLLGNNLRTAPSSSELSFITSLTNCRFLTFLSIADNRLSGVIPPSVGNLSSLLQLRGDTNELEGSIPVEIGNLSSLVILALQDNNLSGNIPLTIKRLHELQGLNLGGNMFEGSVPEAICDLYSLNNIYISRNRLSCPIPQCLGNVSSLRHIFLDSNMLNSSIPSTLWGLKDLNSLDLSSNSLTGVLPQEISNLGAAFYINLSMNQLSGFIPSTVVKLQNLVNLSLANNRLQGSIPVSVGNMISLVSLDLSYNNLSGSIPKSLETLEYLKYLNVSFNSLSGEIPYNGSFENFTMNSFMGNEALCGISRFYVRICHAASTHRSKKKKVVEVALFTVLGVVGLITIVSLAFIFIKYKRKNKTTRQVDELISIVPQRISYYELLHATAQFNESNLIGTGSSCSVYRGILDSGRDIAVKVFNLQLESISRRFDVECEILRSIRHRNLTSVISSCSNEEFKALVLEYMPKGNLEKWLYSHNYCLNVTERLNIMIDVACALEYLHHGYATPIVHSDVKPSNVLLDEDMVGHVSDFGIAKLLGDGDSFVLTNTLATLGYIAPEYGLEGLVSTRCDVYSYGVMVMETFTRKRPSDDMFSGDLSLKSWVENSLLEMAAEVIDANLLMNLEGEEFEQNVKCVSSILELALKCCVDSAGDRINMKEANAELQKIKRQFFPVRSRSINRFRQR